LMVRSYSAKYIHEWVGFLECLIFPALLMALFFLAEICPVVYTV